MQAKAAPDAIAHPLYDLSE